MNKKPLALEFDWQQWSSEPSDLKRTDTVLLARILFMIYLINRFEHALLQLKNADCVWGPVHASVGQEAVAAAAVADYQGIGHRLAAEITQRFFDDLDAPPACLTSLGVPPSVSRVLESAAVLSDQQILEGIEKAARRHRAPYL
jgi:hypothetical protein